MTQTCGTIPIPTLLIFRYSRPSQVTTPLILLSLPPLSTPYRTHLPTTELQGHGHLLSIPLQFGLKNLCKFPTGPCTVQRHLVGPIAISLLPILTAFFFLTGGSTLRLLLPYEQKKTSTNSFATKTNPPTRQTTHANTSCRPSRQCYRY